MTAVDDGTSEHTLRIGVDTGGTFTDVVLFDPGAGTVTITKTPSTPDDPARGFMAGVRQILDHVGRDGDAVASVSHGTTVATNALLTDDYAGLGFVTTEGFRHLLEIARQSVPEGYGNSYFWVKPPRIVPLHHVREVPERLGPEGEVVRDLDEDATVEVARWLRRRDITCVGISFLHSYANPDHERRVQEVFATEHPGCTVSISSDVLREYREYERAVTTLVDAFVKPRVGRYVAQIRAGLDEVRPDVPFYVMKSNGGVISAEEVARQPITTILSGPAAGALGAALIADAAGYDRVLTLDGGGTSTDVCVVTDGEPALTTEGTVGRFPTKVPMIDVVTVGTGGGSIAWRTPDGALKVGPRSAGADPGPLCYGRGGTEPTATDAHLVLGRLPDALLDGAMPLDAAAARAGIANLADDLGIDHVERCAEGVLEIAVWNQANAIRQVTVKRGLDVRDYVLATFGGSGSLQVCRLLDLLELPAAIVPANPGNLSAFGLLTVDVRNDDVQTFVRHHDGLDLAELADVYGALRDRAAAALATEGFAEHERSFVRQADLRYAGQASEVRVDVPDGPVDGAFAAKVIARFHDRHEATYGYCYRDDPSQGIEWVNVRVSGIGPIARPQLRRLDAGDGDPGRAAVGDRQVHLDGVWHTAQLYARAGLLAGDHISGPAVVQEFSSTVPLSPGFAARVDDLGNLVIRHREDP
ncbi:MAG TPA: hydantoinase/oxoprolinase family protein [Euzebyales bacterium]|nr:hydantoinase/oxoprolinase family protein [Euzebyales bacterium]